jgi:hypothetical protein
MKNTFDMLINRLDTANERMFELENTKKNTSTVVKRGNKKAEKSR